MKATGIVRKIDNLGRIVLPKELRDTMDLDIKSPIEIYVEEDRVILKKYEPACIFCGNTDNTIEYMGKTVCQDCRKKMNIKEPA